MVAIAQLVEPWIVIPVVASSNLVSHPINFGSFFEVPSLSNQTKRLGE